jgi:Amt family ammonium transporter
MVLVMVPGLAFLYSGLARRKSALSLIWACMFSASVITFQWYFWGYSLAFGPGTSGFIGNLDKFGLKGVLGAPSQGSPLIPELLYAFYQVCRNNFLNPYANLTVYSRCNSAVSPLPLSSVVLLSAVA